MSDKYVIACDFGTSSVKVIAYSTKKEIIASVTEKYDLYVNGVCAEQDPTQFWVAVGKAVKEIMRTQCRPEDCLGVAFGTQWRGIIPIDSEGNILRRAIIWMDKRAIKQAEELNEKLGKKLFCESDYWPKLMWFKENEPDLYEKSSKILEVNSFIKWKATGRMVSDLTNCYTKSYGKERQFIYNRILDAAGLDPAKFPELCEASEKIGTVTKEASQELGLPEGTPVFGGCCDIVGLAVGSGCSSLGAVHAYLGTSGWLGCIAKHDPSQLYLPPLNKEQDVGFYGLGISVGPSTQWMLDNLFAEECREYGKDIWKEIDKKLDEIPAGADRLLATPWFFGARPPMASGKARATFVNLKGSHTKYHMMRALLEGYCYNMRQSLEQFSGKLDHKLEYITVCGGGSANRHWMQAAADILKTRICVPSDSQSTGAVGIAYCALIGLGLIDGFDALKDYVSIEKTYEPQEKNFEEYDLLYSQYTKLYEQLKGVFETLNG